ncbi:MAG: DUF3311 domain-containing protein [Methyloceanibacter sp.]
MPDRKKPDSRKKPWLWRYWPRFLFLIPFLAVLFVSSYNRSAPALEGIPFFYWYQLAWILAGACLVLLVYWIESKVTRVTGEAREEGEPTGVPGDIL